ncbi:flagellar biosynthetic protein FliR, partial [Pantoea septica]
LALGLLNRLTPQLSIFVIGFPLTLTVGMLSLSMLMRTLTPFLENLLRLLFDGLDEMLMMFI